MSQRAVRVTLGSALLLALLSLVLVWVDGHGQLRRVHWQPPQPVAFDVSQLAMNLPQRTVEQRQLLQILERPLFSPSRRPPPPPPPTAAADAASASLSDVHLYGMYGAGAAGGAIVRVDGKDQHLSVNESVRGWKLVRVGDDGITLRRGAQERTIELVRVIVGADKAAAGVARKPSVAPTGPSAPPLPVAPTTQVPSAGTPTQPGTEPAVAPAAPVARAVPDAPASPPRYSGPQSSSAKSTNSR